tara:strand:+ start:61 stop:225 length:165 start_codon:yes stop_codon:yes gene_type:complete
MDTPCAIAPAIQEWCEEMRIAKKFTSVNGAERILALRRKMLLFTVAILALTHYL